MGKLLVEANNGITVMDLVNLCSVWKLPIKTKISVMGAEARYVVVDKENGCITLDECNCLEENNEEYTKLILVNEQI